MCLIYKGCGLRRLINVKYFVYVQRVFLTKCNLGSLKKETHGDPMPKIVEAASNKIELVRLGLHLKFCIASLKIAVTTSLEVGLGSSLSPNAITLRVLTKILGGP